MPAPRLTIDDTALLVVDLQERLVPVMREPDALLAQAGTLIDGAAALELPILVTEQYRKGLGVTVPTIAEKLGGLAVSNHEKLKFSACIEPVLSELNRRQRRTVLVCGIEAHVCVLQTCLDLRKAGFIPAVAVDAVSSRRTLDMEVALRRMEHCGVLLTTVESCLLEIVHEAGTERFKSILPLIR